MTQLILNPVKLPLPLLPAESKFAACLADGEPCLVGNGELPRIPIIYDDSGNPANVVRSEVICFFAYGGSMEGGKYSIRGPSIFLRGAWICGKNPLDLMYAVIPYALRFSNCRFAVDVNMSNMECAALYLDGSHLARGLDAERLKTRGNVHLRDGFFAEDEVRLLGANIGGNLDCKDGKFVNPNRIALVADGVATKGSVYLRHNFSAEGEVRLLGASIVGDLDCARGNFNNLGGNALAADGMTVKGDVSLRSGFSAKGVVRFSGARIGGDMNCYEGQFVSREKNELAFAADDVRISGALWWRGTTGRGVVNLGHARADVLADDMDSWNSFKVILDGFTYGRFSHPADAKSRIEWMVNRPDSNEWDIPSFSPLPYEQAAKVLSGMGHPVHAWDILREKRWLEREHNKDSWLQRAWGRVIDTLTDFVYRPLRTVKWTARIVLVGAVFFGVADHCERIVPHQPIVLANEGYQESRDTGKHPFDASRTAVPDYPGFNPLVFSLDVFVPLFNLHQESYWAPDSGEYDFFRGVSRGEWRFEWLWLLSVWYWIEIMAGWILSSLLLLSVTGLLRPRIGGGD